MIVQLDIPSKPKDLSKLQQQMLCWLLEADPQIKQSLTGTKKVSAETRLDIYANAYKFRLIDALSDTFPALHTLLGDDDFFQLATAYIDQYPSQHFSLRYFGHKLNSFLAEDKNYKDQPVLAEMAQFEWLLREAFDASDSSSLTMEQLLQVEPQYWPQLTFAFHASVNRLDLRFNIPQLWQVIENEGDPIDIV